MTRRLDVALDQLAVKVELEQHLPDRLVHREAVRVVLERLEQEFQGAGTTILGELPAEGEGGAPVLRPVAISRRHRSSNRSGWAGCRERAARAARGRGGRVRVISHEAFPGRLGVGGIACASARRRD